MRSEHLSYIPKEEQKEKLPYIEKAWEVPLPKQEETGITRIRQRIVQELPKTFGNGFPYANANEAIGNTLDPVKHIEVPDYSKCIEFIQELTEQRLPGKNTWSHVFMGDHGMEGEESIKIYENYKKEGFYFQEMKRKSSERNESYYATREGGPLHIKNNNGEAFCFSVENLPDRFYSGYWLEGVPAFGFGPKNEMFVKYIESILNNKETRKLVEGLPRGYGGAVYESKENLRRLEALIEGENLTKDQTGYYRHPFIPIVSHPEIKPLRWCHAEVAIMTTKKGSLSAMFFETD